MQRCCINTIPLHSCIACYRSWISPDRGLKKYVSQDMVFMPISLVDNKEEEADCPKIFRIIVAVGGKARRFSFEQPIKLVRGDSSSTRFGYSLFERKVDVVAFMVAPVGSMFRNGSFGLVIKGRNSRNRL